VDGASTDGSVEIIRQYADIEAIRLKGYEAIRQENCKADKQVLSPNHLITSSPITWISEKDRGVYDAQNKGIRLAHGEYCYFLNAGDTFCADDVLERMFSPNSLIASSPHHLPDILYGNEVIVDGAGQRVGVARGVENPSFVDLYNSCMKHQASFIRRSLFDKYGMYDADMRICSDFDWFFRVIAFHDEVTLQYKDIDIAYFENTGLSYHCPELCAKERQQILDRCMSKRMQRDYAMLGKYPRLSRVGENRIVKLLLRIANRLLK
jgi:glycosyltransferase involved in cell wall biosynthesis